MQNRRMILALVASIGVFYLWMTISLKLWPPQRPATQPAPTATMPAPPQPTAATCPLPGAPSTAPATAWTPPAEVAPEAAGRVRVQGGDRTESLVVGGADGDSPFPMELTIHPRGAAVERAAIRGYYMTVARKNPYEVLSPAVVALRPGWERTFRSFATDKVRFENLDLDVDLREVNWKVDSVRPDEVVFSVRVESREGKPVAVVRKRYHVPAQPRELLTFDMVMTVTIDNLTDAPLQVILTQREAPRREDRRVTAAFWTEGQLEVDGHYRQKVLKKGVIPLCADDDKVGMRVAWAGLSNQYFTCLMAPHGRLKPEAPPLFAMCEAITITGEAGLEQGDVTLRYITRPIPVAPHASAEVAFDCYVGPKSKRAFQKVAAYRVRDYYNVIREGFYFCAPAGLVALMMTLLDTFHRIPPHNYGLSIIILVLIVRGLLHPITKRSQVNMMKMQKEQAALQPKIKAIRAKYANDRVKMNQAMMELYREEGINPAGSVLACLPMLLQLPIWAALWTALASTIEMRHAPFDGWWIKDLAGPDAFYTFPHPVEVPLLGFLLGGPIHSLNLLPILLGISQFLQTKFMPRSTSPQPEGAPDQRKMMMFMSFFFVFLLYNAPSGLNLYIMASNVFGILEQHRIRKHIAEYEANREAEVARRKAAAAQKRQKSWLHRKWEELAREAEEARRSTPGRKKPRK